MLYRIIIILILQVELILCVFKSSDDLKQAWSANLQEQLNWVRPTRSDEFDFDDTSKCIDFDSYDFVIVGGGAAGTVLAGRLSEMTEKTVLLLEAGDGETDYSLIPAADRNIRASAMNWGYLVEPQSKICKSMINNQCSFEAGKALGGSSAINGLAITKGNKQNFNDWQRIVHTDWSAADILPYFKKSENATNLIGVAGIELEPAYHGFNGPISVSTNTPPPALSDLILQGFRDYGLKIRDVNGRQQIGASLSQNNVYKGMRMSNNQAYIQSIKNERDNLQVLTKALGIEVLFDGKTATGVKFIANNTCYNAFANNEVILSAGTINSPKILLQSGVGPTDHLESMGIYVKFDLPVGNNLRDQIAVTGIAINTNQNVTLSTFDEDIDDYFKGIGPLTYVDNEEMSFLKVNKKGRNDVPDTEIVCHLHQKYADANVTFKASNYKDSMSDAFFNSNSNPSQILCNVVYLSTKSVGSLRLKSNDPLDYPRIDPRYLSNEDDRLNFISSLLELEKILKSKTFRSINAEIQDFGIPECTPYFYKSSRVTYWNCIIKHIAMPYLHEIGTCRMGKSARDSVVDGNLRVHGIDNLMVVDASVIPLITSGHTMQPVTAIAEKISDYIKDIYM